MTESRFKVLGDYLKKYRVKRGLSQKDVGKKIGNKSSQFVSNFERGLCSPPLEALQVLIGLYHLPQKEVLKILLGEQEKHLKRRLFGQKSRH